MVEKITIAPAEVRGLGNVVSPKSLSDFVGVGDKISEGTATVTGVSKTVYNTSNLDKCTLSVTCPRLIDLDDTSFTISVVLYNALVSVSEGIVFCRVNGVTRSAEADGNGECSFTVNTDGSQRYDISVYCLGDGSEYSGDIVNTSVFVAEPDSLDLTVDKSIIQTGETSNLIATLTGTGVDGETVGIPNQTVQFYEEWTPGLAVSVDKNIFQTGDTCNIKTQLIDTVDGSLVRESGHAVTVYQQTDNGVIFHLPTEQTLTSTNMKFYDGLCTLYDFEDSDWTLEFDIKTSSGLGGGVNIGATSQYTPPSRADWRLFVGVDDGKFGFNNRRTSSDGVYVGSVTTDTYYHMKMVKEGTSVSAYYDGNLIAVKTVDWLGDYVAFDVYLVCWSGTSYVKNIVLKIIGGE